MSLNPTLGHLYHDRSFDDHSIRLDAHEQLRTRQRNAREDRQLGKYSKTLDRAKSICQRRYEWEENEVRNQLYSIQSRTPSLQLGLQRESERLSRYEESISETRHQFLSRVSIGNKSGSRITTAKTLDSNMSSDSKQSTSITVTDLHSRKTLSLPSGLTVRGSSALTFSEDNSYNSDVNFSKPQVSYIKKAENITKSLHKLYRRKKERKSANKYLMEYVRSDNRELLMKARVFFKGTEAAHVLEKLLAAKEEPDERNQDPLPVSSIKDDMADESKRNSSSPKRVYINEITINRDSQDVSNSEKSLVTTENCDATGDTATPVPGNPDVALSLENVNSSLPCEKRHVAPSVMVNPSESSVEAYEITPRRVKFSDQFGVPELWKLYYEKQRLSNNKEERKTSLVTITARYRRTLVR